jgi:hypothetical protein
VQDSLIVARIGAEVCFQIPWAFPRRCHLREDEETISELVASSDRLVSAVERADKVLIMECDNQSRYREK